MLGSREPYHARVVPYFSNTDHMVFNDSWVGVPGTTLTNWPDEYIHSSDDDLWQVDPTQLERNAFIVAATALWLANAGAPEAAYLASHVAGRGIGRLGSDFATGLARIASATPPRDADYRARGEPSRGIRRERDRGDRVRARARSDRRRDAPLTVAPLEQASRELQALLVAGFRERSGGSAPSDPPSARKHRRETRAETRGRDSRRVDGAPGEGPRAARGRGETATGRAGGRRALRDPGPATRGAQAAAPGGGRTRDLPSHAVRGHELDRRKEETRARSPAGSRPGDVGGKLVLRRGTADRVEKFLERQAKDG